MTMNNNTEGLQGNNLASIINGEPLLFIQEMFALYSFIDEILWLNFQFVGYIE